MKEAQQNWTKTASQQKKLFDRRTKPRELQVGDEVLVLPPSDDHKLEIWWQGPLNARGKLAESITKLRSQKRGKNT
jgi:hypothetical protein